MNSIEGIKYFIRYMIDHDDLLDFFKLCEENVDKIERINYFPLDIIVESPDVSGEELYPLGTDEWAHHVENSNFYQLSNLYLQKNFKSAMALWKEIKENLSSTVRYNFSINIDFQPDITETELYDWMAGREYNWEDLQLRMRLGSLWFHHLPKRLRNRTRHLGKDLQTHFISGKRTTIAIHSPTYRNDEIEVRYGGDSDSSVICRDEPDDEVIKMIVESYKAVQDEEGMWGGCLISNMFEVDLEDLSYVIEKSIPLFYNELLDMNQESDSSSSSSEEDEENDEVSSLAQFAKKLSIQSQSDKKKSDDKKTKYQQEDDDDYEDIEEDEEEEKSTTPKSAPPTNTGVIKHPFFNIPSNRMPIHVITSASTSNEKSKQQTKNTVSAPQPLPVEEIEEKKTTKRGKKKSEQVVEEVPQVETPAKKTRAKK